MYNDKPILDVHAHISVPVAANVHLLNLVGTNSVIPNPMHAVDKVIRGSGLTEADYEAAASGHVEYINERSIDAQILGPRPFIMLGSIEPHLIEPWTQYVNDLIEQQVRFFPDRFLGAAALPQHASAPSTAHCIPELERCVKEKGFVAAYFTPDPDGRRTAPGLNDPYWFELYEACESLEILLIMHGTTYRDHRTRHVPHNYQLGFLVEQYLGVQSLTHSDVFERFPELRVISCHCGGALNRFIPTDPHLAQVDLTENLFYDTCVYDLNLLEAAIKQRSARSLCYGVEAPGSGRFLRPETGRSSDDLVPIIAGFEWLSDEDKDSIFYDNAARLCPKLSEVGWRAVSSRTGTQEA